MITIRWTPTASGDLESIYDYIARDNSDAASKVMQRITSAIEGLKSHPEMGRRGRAPGTRELVSVPYIVTYRIRDSVVVIANIVHSARRWRAAF
jgi:toxin ParE1/3/4